MTRKRRRTGKPGNRTQRPSTGGQAPTRRTPETVPPSRPSRNEAAGPGAGEGKPSNGGQTRQGMLGSAHARLLGVLGGATTESSEPGAGEGRKKPLVGRLRWRVSTGLVGLAKVRVPWGSRAGSTELRPVGDPRTAIHLGLRHRTTHGLVVLTKFRPRRTPWKASYATAPQEGEENTVSDEPRHGMAPKLTRLRSPGFLRWPKQHGEDTSKSPPLSKTVEPKPPLPLPLFFMLSHMEEDGPVRMDGVKLRVWEVMGLELDEPKLGSFAGALNALDFPVQLLVRQHPPDLHRLRTLLEQSQPPDLPPKTKEAAESLRDLMMTLENRDGILDRRFYAVCQEEHADELRGLLARSGLAVHPLRGRHLRMLLLACSLGGSPTETDEETPAEVVVNRRDVRVRDHLTRSLHLGRWPRTLSAGFLQGLMAAGVPMDLSIHLDPIPSEQAARTLEWQKVRFESAQSISLRRGRTMSPEAEIALEDVSRLRDEVQRGRERLFHGSLSITLHAADAPAMDEMTQRAKAHFAATLGKLDALAFRQREGLLSTLPLNLNAVAVWRTLDTSSMARLFPFSPPDLDTRSGTLYGIDLRACSPVVYDPFDGTHLNANTAVLARSGSGKSFATKLGVLRGLCRGVTAYVIDPEGEYADMARAAGGRVLSPGVAGQGMNPFVVDTSDDEEVLLRIGSLRRLIEVMVGERLSAEKRASLDHWLAAYYSEGHERTGFRDFFAYLESEDADDPESGSGHALQRLLRPFATGSLRHLLSDDGDDLLHHEALVTVFDLRLLEPELRPAAAMVCTETVWAAAARDPRPRLLVVDEVWSIMQHPEGAAFMVGMAKRARKHRLGLQFITQDVQDLLSEDSSRTITGHSGRALLQNAAFKLLLQQDAAAISTVGEAFDLPPELQRWLLSCPRGDGLLLARGGRFPIRIEATAEEQAIIEWTPGRHE